MNNLNTPTDYSKWPTTAQEREQFLDELAPELKERAQARHSGEALMAPPVVLPAMSAILKEGIVEYERQRAESSRLLSQRGVGSSPNTMRANRHYAITHRSIAKRLRHLF